MAPTIKYINLLSRISLCCEGSGPGTLIRFSFVTYRNALASLPTPASGRSKTLSEPWLCDQVTQTSEYCSQLCLLSLRLRVYAPHLQTPLHPKRIISSKSPSSVPGYAPPQRNITNGVQNDKTQANAFLVYTVLENPESSRVSFYKVHTHPLHK